MKVQQRKWIDLILFFRPSVSVFSIVGFGAAGHNARVTNFGPFPCFIGHGLGAAEVEVVPKPKVGANCRTHPLPPSEREGGRANCFKARLNKLSLLVGAKGGRSIHRMYGFLINRHTSAQTRRAPGSA